MHLLFFPPECIFSTCERKLFIRIFFLFFLIILLECFMYLLAGRERFDRMKYKKVIKSLFGWLFYTLLRNISYFVLFPNMGRNSILANVIKF